MEQCPDEETILAFVGGGLSAYAVTVLEQHADGCPTCIDLIAVAAGALHEAGNREAIGGVFAGYRILDVIGVGGMGIVYRAVHVASGERVALKTVRPQAPGALASIRREIHTL